ncbi:DUF3078 domain-containing protein [Tamlana fucoidanivorans]|uniref:DUF3078 domain-containing protein n=1 Tax=Allotamlana fucoidanivorans TaxID=2583814 RepID=A0A5C4SIW7_9FLAO|nr:DUF3078 domain-containing protein [Tamlana fucoidanivorans]TNJ42846.1 DUF3078 domain-containing protein [Tamlana fucoidanivorans]
MRILLFLVVCMVFNNAYTQPNWLFLREKEKVYEGPQWKQVNKASLDLNQSSFVNWNAGGTNSISGLVDGKSMLNYKDKFYVWNNDIHMRYGINAQQDRETRKTDDLIELNSNIGYRSDSKSNWYYMARMNFRTQFTNGYKYPNTENPISKFMAPGYVFFGGGIEYGKDIQELSFYFSPLTLKGTFVLDENLANSGSFGVTPAVYDDEGNLITPGERFRKEFGVLLTNAYEMDLAQNINVKHQISLYSDYLNKFGNIDLDWRLDFAFKVNSFMRATLGSHMRYDDDVKTKVPSEENPGEFDERGAKLQWKQFLGIGVAFDF